MFPTVISENQNINESKSKVISTSTQLSYTPFFDFNKKEFILSNGSPKLVNDVDAMRQWIILFIITPRGIYEIYDGTPFGTSIYKLKGQKWLNNGFEEAQIEKECREGFVLNPAIKRLASFNMAKKGNLLSVSVKVELYDGTLVEETVEDVFTVK